MSFSAWALAQCDTQTQQWHLADASFPFNTMQAASVDDLQRRLARAVPNFLVEAVQEIGTDGLAVRFSGQLYDELEEQADNA